MIYLHLRVYNARPLMSVLLLLAARYPEFLPEPREINQALNEFYSIFSTHFLSLTLKKSSPF